MRTQGQRQYWRQQHLQFSLFQDLKPRGRRLERSEGLTRGQERGMGRRGWLETNE